jgi:hypothetical protein
MFSDLSVGHFTSKRIAKWALLKRFKYRFMAVSMDPICSKSQEQAENPGRKARGGRPLKEKSRSYAPTGPFRLVAPFTGETLGGCLLHVKEDVKGGKEQDKSHNTQGDCGDLFGFLT